MAFHFTENHLYIEPYSGGDNYQCQSHFPKHRDPGHHGYQTARSYIEPYSGGNNYQCQSHFPIHHDPGHHGNQTACFVNFEPSSSGGSMKIRVEEDVDDEADDYIKGIHKNFESRQWMTFSKGS